MGLEDFVENLKKSVDKVKKDVENAFKQFTLNMERAFSVPKKERVEKKEKKRVETGLFKGQMDILRFTDAFRHLSEFFEKKEED